MWIWICREVDPRNFEEFDIESKNQLNGWMLCEDFGKSTEKIFKIEPMALWDGEEISGMETRKGECGDGDGMFREKRGRSWVEDNIMFDDIVFIIHLQHILKLNMFISAISKGLIRRFST